jgi:4-hydroxy-2-oxoheptanedioate aldolase
MNQHMQNMLYSLERLKGLGAFEIKAEFEAEATRMEEMIWLQKIISKTSLPLIIKTGGVEAITDCYSALSLGAKAIVAPMAETAFALQKFLNLIKNNLTEDDRKNTEFHFNLETITAYKNLDEILGLEDIKLLTGLTIGRVDLTGSMLKTSSYANSEEIYRICEDTFTKAKTKGLKCALGGAISSESNDFIQRLIDKNLIDKFETRKVVFSPLKTNNINSAIEEAVRFELEWLKYKKSQYKLRHLEDDTRIEMLEKRLKKNLFMGRPIYRTSLPN